MVCHNTVIFVITYIFEFFSSFRNHTIYFQNMLQKVYNEIKEMTHCHCVLHLQVTMNISSILQNLMRFYLIYFIIIVFKIGRKIQIVLLLLTHYIDQGGIFLLRSVLGKISGRISAFR